VDNGSKDGTTTIIENDYPDVNLIRSPENLGYGGGVNLGVEHASNEYLVILNPDTIVGEKAIDNLLQPIRNNENLVTIPKVLLYDGSEINTCGNHEHFTGLTFTRYLGHPPDEHNDKEFVDGLSGVCFAIKKSDFQKIGGFDENFFIYMEDSELSWRILANNMNILYIPDSVIYHDYELEVTPEKIYHLEIGRYLIIRKYFTKKKLIAFLPSFIMSEVLTLGYSVLQGKKGLEYKFKAFNDSRKKNIDKMQYNTADLIFSLDWKIPDEQLSYNILDHTLRQFANLVNYLNYCFICKIVLIRDKPVKNKNLSTGK